MKLSKQALLVASFAISFTSCKQEEQKDIAQTKKIPGIVLENMDTSVSPKEDFYNYVNGSWMKEYPDSR